MSNQSNECNAHVVVFGYKRPQHLKQTLEHLASAEGSSSISVTIFIDGSKNELEKDLIQDTYDVAIQDFGFLSKKVNRALKNQGLAKSILSGVSTILKSNEHVIVLEDDVLVGYGFLRFMNEALCRYENIDNVFSISGYVPPKAGAEIEKINNAESVGFVPRPGSWGWATWRRAWQDAIWVDSKNTIDISNSKWSLNVCGNDVKNMFNLQQEGLIDSWAIQWAMHHYINDGLSLYPSKSFVENIGMDGSGTHCSTTQRYATNSQGINLNLSWPKKISVSTSVLKAFCHTYNRKPISYIKWPLLRLINWFKSKK